MKILMIAPQPFFEPRGTPFSVLGRLRALSELGHEVDLVTYHIGRDVPVPNVRIFRTPRIGFIKSVKIGPSVPKLFLDVLVFAKTFQMLWNSKYDLLHTHEEASFFGVLLAKLFRLPHIYDMHSSPPQQLKNFEVTGFGPLVRLFEWIERRVVGSSNVVITICPALQDHVDQMQSAVPHVMIENVGSEIDLNVVPQGRMEEISRELSALGNRRIVLYAGTFEAYQGLDLLLDSAQIVAKVNNDVMFLMVGGQPEQVERLQTRVDQLGLGRNFLFTGTRPPEEIPVFIQASHALVSPRTSGTNTPLKIYSYLNSGKPIVATNLYTHTQVLNTDISMLVEPEPRAFARGIMEILQNPTLASMLGKQAREHFERNYTFQVFLQKTNQVLQLATR